jgi:hypothetical protein
MAIVVIYTDKSFIVLDVESFKVEHLKVVPTVATNIERFSATNTLAYLPGASVTDKKGFHDVYHGPML